VKPIDRADQIYFRVEDVIDPEVEIRITKDLEVDFFVIVENSKGKMSNRAVHLQVLPPGTVQFEVTVASDVEAVVTVEAKAQGD
jgi:hypothetical protein